MDRTKSYWTVRRNIRKAVSRHMSDISKSCFSYSDNAIDCALSCPLPQRCLSNACPTVDLNNAHVRESDANNESVGVLATNSLCHPGDAVQTDPVFQLSTNDEVSSDDDLQATQIGLPEKLADWARSFRIPLNALSSLLAILHDDHPCLPKDARTLLGTVTEYAIKHVAGGEYYHFGLKASLTQQLPSINVPSGSSISVQINIDGLPIFKSSGTQFWPILGMIDGEQRSSPFVIGVFCGNSKPTSLSDYLREFVDDCKNLEKDGLVVGDEHYRFRISAVVCDAPARAFVKGVKCYAGYEGCDKCKQHGTWCGKVTYPETVVELREDKNFNSDQGSYNIEVSPITELNVGMVSNFPVDYMHQCCLGVTRRILRLLIKGPLSVRLGPHVVTSMSDWLISIKGFVPNEFSRKPRALRELDRWKATELRFFMLYSGPIVMKKFVPKAVYDNFLLFSTVMHILLSPKFSSQTEMVDYAEQLSVSFVNHFGQIYGPENLVYNVHSIIHLANDVRMFGNLDNVSSFPFENYLGCIKRFVRKPAQPLQQLVRRLSEQCDTKIQETEHDVLKKLHNGGPVPLEFFGANQYRELHSVKFFLSTEFGDNCVLINDRVSCIQNILAIGSQTIIVFRSVFVYLTKNSLCLPIHVIQHYWASELCPIWLCAVILVQCLVWHQNV
jgi:hypothetical protein